MTINQTADLSQLRKNLLALDLDKEAISEKLIFFTLHLTDDYSIHCENDQLING